MGKSQEDHRFIGTNHFRPDCMYVLVLPPCCNIRPAFAWTRLSFDACMRARETTRTDFITVIPLINYGPRPACTRTCASLPKKHWSEALHGHFGGARGMQAGPCCEPFQVRTTDNATFRPVAHRWRDLLAGSSFRPAASCSSNLSTRTTST
jgi:hypothetical protein